MKKAYLILFIFSFILSEGYSQSIKQVEVVSVRLSIETVIRVSCKQFDYQFNDEKKTSVLKNKKEINKISHLLLKSKNEKKYDINVRGKLIISYQGKKSRILYFDEFGIFTDEKAFFENKALLKFLLKNHIIED